MVHSLDIEANCWHCADDLAQVQLTQDGSLACVVKPDDDHAHLLASYKAAEDFGKHKTHLFINYYDYTQGFWGFGVAFLK